MRWTAAGLVAMVAMVGVAWGQGRQLGPQPTLEWEGPIDVLATGGTLLDCTPALSCGGGSAASNCVGRARSTIGVAGFPNLPGLHIVHARLNWAASGPGSAQPDPSVTLTPPGGSAIQAALDPALSEEFHDGLPGDQCGIVQLLCPAIQQCDLLFYSAYADLTAAVQAHVDGGGALNGDWTIGDVSVAGANENDGATAVAVVASLVIGGWSLIVVYESDALPLRRIYYYQGMELNEGADRTLRARGFRAPPDPTVDVTFMVLEGDEGITGDSLAINGVLVADACNPVRNVFNSTISAGRAEGACLRGEYSVDIDHFTVEDALEPGDEQADVTFIVPRGDGFLTAGEQILTNWLVLAFDHRPANFDSLKPEKTAVPPSGASVEPGDEITYLITVRNDGGDFAANVRVTDGVPEGTVYIPNTMSVDRRPVADLPGGRLPLEPGFNLADLPEIDLIAPNEAHVVQFQVRVADGVAEEFIIRNSATIEADDVSPVLSDLVVHAVGRVPDGGIPVPDAMPMPPARMDFGRPPPARDAGPGPDEGRCPVGERLTVTGGCEPIPCPDGSVLEGAMCVEPAANPCGGGQELVNGRCEAICGAGLRWDRTCPGGGQCRYLDEAPCQSEGGGSSDGCSCDAARSGEAPVLGLLLLPLLGGLRRRRRGRA